MLNFFKRKADTKKEEPKEDLKEPEAVHSRWHKDEAVDGCIIYYVTKSGETHVDVELSDYSDSTVDNFCVLMETIGDDSTFLETIDIVKEGFVKAGREDLFVILATRLIQNANLLDILKEKPCIRPSDML